MKWLLICFIVLFSSFLKAEHVQVVAGTHWLSSDVYDPSFMLPEFDDSAWHNAVLLYGGAPQPDEELGNTPLMWHYQGVEPFTAETLPIEAYFRTSFSLSGHNWRGVFNYYANDEMDLYVNGNLAVRDRSDAGNKAFDIDVTQWLKTGENTLAIYAYDGGASGPYERGMNWIGMNLEINDVAVYINTVLLFLVPCWFFLARK